MLRLLIYIKHHLSFIWFFIEWLNSVVFQLLYGRILNNNLKKLLETYQGEFNYRFCKIKMYLYWLISFLGSQKKHLSSLNLMDLMFVR